MNKYSDLATASIAPDGPTPAFASDNTCPAHPRILAALNDVNRGAVKSYGDDPWSEAAQKKLRDIFGPDSRAFFTMTGTAANIIGLRAVLFPWNSIICAAQSHINVDECGAAEANTGAKVHVIPSADAKLHPGMLAAVPAHLGNVHHSQPAVISITQSTELGTLYTPDEIRELATFAHEHGMLLHMDGSRIANAAAALDCTLAAQTADAGVDILSLGGTKNGLLFGEAVVFLKSRLAERFPLARKQSMHLLSKMRYLSAQFLEYLHDDLWLKNARNANAMAALLAEKLKGAQHAIPAQPVRVNALFLLLNPEHIASLLQHYHVYDLGPSATMPHLHEVRFMTNYATQADEVEQLAKTIIELAG